MLHPRDRVRRSHRLPPDPRVRASGARLLPAARHAAATLCLRAAAGDGQIAGRVARLRGRCRRDNRAPVHDRGARGNHQAGVRRGGGAGQLRSQYAALRRAGQRAEPAAAVSRAGLDRPAPHRPAHRGAGGRDAGRHQPARRPGGGPYAPHRDPRSLGVHRGEGGRERGHGRCGAGLLPRDPGPGGERGVGAATAPPARRQRWRW